MMNQVSKYKSQVLSILVLPFNAGILIPGLIYYFSNEVFRFQWLLGNRIGFLIAGSLFLLCGFLLFVKTVQLFSRIGKGTLAPWDPPKKLVVAGPYRYVRNPMISAVNMLLLAQVFLFASAGILIWQLFFFCANHIYFLFVEEPNLAKKFGSDYLQYKKKVPRWIPDLRKFFS